MCLRRLLAAPRRSLSGAGVLTAPSARCRPLAFTAPQEHQSSGPAGKLALLVRALRHESPGVRHAALGALRSFMLRSKRFVRALAASAAPGARPVVGARGAAAGGGSAAGGNGGAAGGGEEDGGGPELLGDLMGALMACCDNVPPGLAVQMRQRCARRGRPRARGADASLGGWGRWRRAAPGALARGRSAGAAACTELTCAATR